MEKRFKVVLKELGRDYDEWAIEYSSKFKMSKKDFLAILDYDKDPGLLFVLCCKQYIMYS